MATNGRTELEVGADGVAVITIYNPPVNSLSIDGMALRSTLYRPKSAFLIFPIFFFCEFLPIFLVGRFM
jgi:hypothetical protein